MSRPLRPRLAAALLAVMLGPLAMPACAAKKTPAKPTKAATKVAKAGKARSAPKARSAFPAPEVEFAEIRDDEAQGLRGSASFYGSGFQGRKTSSGERFDVKQFTAASNRFPLGAKIAVRRLDNDRCVIVRVTDRMGAHRNRVIDVSRSAAESLGMIRSGVVMVRAAPLHKGADGDCLAAFEAEDGPAEFSADKGAWGR